jgi:hypothetical protein
MAETMGEPWSTALLAISYEVLPELREQRCRYYQFWNAIGATAIVGWLVVLALYRLRTPKTLSLVGLVAAVVALGGGLGWALWSGLSGYSWGDVGVGSRWLGELTACILGCVGWLLVARWLILCRR